MSSSPSKKNSPSSLSPFKGRLPSFGKKQKSAVSPSSKITTAMSTTHEEEESPALTALPTIELEYPPILAATATKQLSPPPPTSAPPTSKSAPLSGLSRRVLIEKSTESINHSSSSKTSSPRKHVSIDEHLLTIDQLATKLQTAVMPKFPLTSIGLTPDKLERKQRQFGANVIKPPKKKPWYIKFLECLTNLFNLMLIFAGCGNVLMYIDDPDRNYANSYLGVILMCVAVLNTFIEFHQMQRISAMVASFSQLVPAKANVVRDRELKDIPASEIVPGDVVFIKFGDKAPADLVIFHASELKVDNSSLTGESESQDRHPFDYTIQRSRDQEKSSVRQGTLSAVDHNKRFSEDPWESPNIVFGGSIVQSGEGYGLAIKTGDDTVMGQIANLSSSSKSKPSSPLSREIRRFCKLITFLASATAVVFFIIAWAGGRSFNYAMQFGIGILIAWVPQGLPLTVTMLLAIAGQRMSKRQVLVKDLYGVETLGAITLLCSDKTGTLTCNQMNVTNVWTNRIMYYAGQNPEDAPKSERLLRMDTSGVAQILHIAATCTRARFETSSESTSNYNDHNHPHEKRTTSLSSSWTPPPSVSSSSGPSSNIIGDPTDAGLLRWAATRLKNIEKLPSLYPKIFEIPFTSDTKCHITIHRKSHREGGLTLHVKGAPEIIFDLCSTIMLDGQAIPCSDQQQQYRKSFMEAYNTMANRGHRVLALAQYALPGTKFPDNFNFSIERRNWPTSGYTFLGLVSLEDPPKVGVADSIAKMKQAGIKVFMITGDHALTAEAVARRVNIVTGLTRDQAAKKYNKSIEAVLPDEYSTVIIEGKRLEHLSQEDWDEMLSKEEVIFARTSPRQKLEIVTMAQSMGHIVGVTGDGVNDAAALRKADLGIAMNLTGSEISKDAARMILLDDNFSSIVKGIYEGRLIFINLKKCIQYTLTHIIPEVIPYLLFVVVPIPLALTAVQILAVDLGFELFTTVSFAWEPEEFPNMITSLPPRSPVTPQSVATIRLKEDQRLKRKAEFISNFNIAHGGGSGVAREGEGENENIELGVNHGAVGGSNSILYLDDDVATTNSRGIVILSPWRKYWFEVKQTFTKTYWINYYRDWRDLVHSSSSNGAAASAGEERLVDSQILSWSYLEGGLIECLGAMVTFVAVLHFEFGVEWIDCVRMQRGGKEYFRPSSPDYILSNGETITGDQQVEALRQAQSSFYLSILIIQIWNLFASKAMYRLPFGLFLYKNTKTWYNLLAGSFFGLFVVYTPGVSDLFVMSSHLNPVYLTIPMTFGAILYFYSALRRYLLMKYRKRSHNSSYQLLEVSQAESPIRPVLASTSKNG